MAELKNFLDAMVKKNGLDHWQLFQRQVTEPGNERFDICMGQESQFLKENEFQLLQNSLLEITHDPVEVDTDRNMITYWNFDIKGNIIIKAGQDEGNKKLFSYATLKTPFINGTECILVFKNKDNQITVELTENIVSAFLVAWRSISSFPEFRNARQVKLGKRERRVLSWTSQGKTSYEISKILNLSEHTINNYVTNAANKLGTNNRVHTVCRAIMLGLI
jgi:DNA-binding CsgD family transcriptional regulator